VRPTNPAVWHRFATRALAADRSHDPVRSANPVHPTPLRAVLRAAADPVQILSGHRFVFGLSVFLFLEKLFYLWKIQVKSIFA
jgi:hypothetical protein